MTWFDSATNEAQSALDHYAMFVAVDFDFPSGHIRLWSGIGDLAILGNTFTGSGDLGKISVPEERAGLDAPRKTFALSGVDPSIVAEADLDACFGRSVIEYFGLLNSETRTLIDDPEINWEGRIDNVRRVDGAEPVIEVNAEHRMILLDQSDGWRCTHEHQQRFYVGDNGFNLVMTLQTKEILWGGERVLIGHVPGTRRRGSRGEPIYGD
jgi:hypothetical protein